MNSPIKNKVVIGMPVSPCTRLSNRTLHATRFIYSMGHNGSTVTFYADRLSIVEREQYFEVTGLVDGEVEKIYKNFIVSQKDVEVLSLSYDATEHANYHSRTCNRKFIYEFYIADHKTEYVISNDFDCSVEGRVDSLCYHVVQ